MPRYPEARKRGLIVIPALSEGEASGTMRVRGPAELVAWAGSLTPAQRGAIFAAARAGGTLSAPSGPLPDAQAGRTGKWRR
jgi:hypothetical protein